MKILSLLLLFCIIQYNVGTPAKVGCGSENYCMACSKNTKDQCDACFNFATGVVLARSLDNTIEPNHCQSTMQEELEIVGCKYYSGKTLVTHKAHRVDTCEICGKFFQTYNRNKQMANCTDFNEDCKMIDNCLTTVCYVDDKGNMTRYNRTVQKGFVEGNLKTVEYESYGCRMCKKGFIGIIFDESYNKAGSKNCTKFQAINNCEFTEQVSKKIYNCYSCKRGYAVSSDQQSCVSFLFDKGCRTLHSGGTDCYYCWHSYYWSGYLCRLNSPVFFGVAFSLYALFAIFVDYQ